MNEFILDIIKAIKKINDEKTLIKDDLLKVSTKEELEIKINELNKNTDKLIVNLKDDLINHIKSIIPKDGINGINGIDGKDGNDAIIDYDLLHKYINDKIDLIEIPKAESVNYDLIETNIKSLINEFVSTIKNGIDGRDGLDGKDGIGIKDIKDNKSFFEIILDNGIKKKIFKPLDMVKTDLSGGIDFKTINGVSIVGKGDIPIESGTGGITPTTNYTNIFYNSLL